ncbi:MAG: hypothetical protein QF679_02140 [Candidatus Pacebacteria bacterium]|jgi:hypothetical protein|nr:hypothetical protein [Candidatus Paceibacterota bacterium]
MAETPQKYKKRIGKVNSLALLGFAVLIDGLQGILTFFLVGVFLNSVIGVLASIVYFIWFKLIDVDFLAMRRMAAMGTAIIVEFIPAINAWPAWTISIGIIIASVNADYLKSKGKKGVFGLS